MLAISKSLTLPADMSTKATAILGIRGSGKTNTGVVIVEGLLDESRPVVIIDPLDVWWGLRSSPGGKQDGYSVVICGGEHGDLPLTESDGATLADFVVEHHVPLVLSLRHLRKAAQQRFVTAFAEQLYHRKGEQKHRTPLMVVIDEADSFVPQRVGGNEARMVGAIEDLVRRGRSAGLGVMMISQRAASINKDVLTQIELLIAHRHTSPQDRAALKSWIEANDDADRQAEFLTSLASLSLGEAWFWSPGWLKLFRQVSVRARKTFDSSGTPTSGKEGGIAAPKRLADVDLGAIRGKLAKTIEQAKADDPKELRKRIAELEKQTKQQKPAAAQPADARFTQEAIDRAVFMSRERRDGEWTKAIKDQSRILKDRIGEVIDFATNRMLDGSFPNSVEPLPDPAPVPKKSSQWPGYQTTLKPKNPSVDQNADCSITGGLRRMMIALAQRPGLNARQLGLRAGMSSSSGTFGTYLGRMRSNVWIDGGRDGMCLTDAGSIALGLYDPLPTGRELLAYWLNELGSGSGASRMLESLANVYPQAMTREQLGAAAAISPTSGTFGTYLGRLRTLELVQGSRELKASDELFA